MYRKYTSGYVIIYMYSYVLEIHDYVLNIYIYIYSKYTINK